MSLLGGFGRSPSKALAVGRKLASIIQQHTDGKGLGISYSPSNIYEEFRGPQLPEAFAKALEAGGFRYNPTSADGSGWHRYVTKDGAYTVAVEGWGDHCLSRDACVLSDFKKEQKRRAEKRRKEYGEVTLAVFWTSSIPLTLDKDREARSMEPLHFKAISFEVLEGDHPHNLEEPIFFPSETLAGRFYKTFALVHAGKRDKYFVGYVRQPHEEWLKQRRYGENFAPMGYRAHIYKGRTFTPVGPWFEREREAEAYAKRRFGG